MTLRDQQAALLAHATGRAGPGPQAGALLKAPDGLLPARLAIYCSGHRARLAEALANDYPALRRVLGEAAFGSMTVRYERRFASRSHDLGRLGQHLAEFLADDPLSAQLPLLADLARLEWALAEAFVAADEPPVRWETLAARGPAAVADRRLRLKAGTALVRSSWPVVAIWRLRDRPDAEVDLPVEDRPETVVVHRDGLELRCRPVSEWEALLVERAVHGFRLSELPDDAVETPRLVEAFRMLVSAGILVDVSEERIGP